MKLGLPKYRMVGYRYLLTVSWIRGSGSIPLTYGSGSGACSFRQWLTKNFVFFTKIKPKIVKSTSAPPTKSRIVLIYRNLKKDIYLWVPMSETSFFFSSEIERVLSHLNDAEQRVISELKIMGMEAAMRINTEASVMIQSLRVRAALFLGCGSYGTVTVPVFGVLFWGMKASLVAWPSFMEAQGHYISIVDVKKNSTVKVYNFSHKIPRSGSALT